MAFETPDVFLHQIELADGNMDNGAYWHI